MSKVFQEQQATPSEIDEMYDDFPCQYPEARRSARSNESATSATSTNPSEVPKSPKRRLCRMTADCFGFIFIATAIIAVTAVASIFVYQLVHCGQAKPMSVCGSGMPETTIETAQKELTKEGILSRIESNDNITVTDSHSNETAQIFAAVAEHNEMLSSHNSSSMNDTGNAM